MNREPIHPRLAGSTPPVPPERLRAAALAAAERGWATRPDLWTRLWESRSVRLAWAAAVLALVAGHVALSASRPRSAPGRPSASGAAPQTLAAHAAPGLDEVTDAMRTRITRINWMGEGLSRRSSGRPLATSRSSKEPS